MIDRYNILELLGADKNRYHSCIITCYSFDFLFFEQRVLPRLRQAGILNVNLFVDARMFQQQLDAGNYRNNYSYSVVPVQLSGAFHPKILMVMGKNNGFLAIGSGNLTSSGLSSNDEVWGAFHTYKVESDAAPLFKLVYQYLTPLEKFCFGINKSKWDWILENTPWLKDIINDTSLETVLKSKDGSIQLLSSFVDVSIYKNILDHLPKEDLESLVIVSPYFNRGGQIIEQFIEDLNPENVRIVVDSRFGTVPYEFVDKGEVQFYDWHKVGGIEKHQSPRLHAKIIQFNYKTKSFILIGSANATVEALGTKSSQTRNAEMSILISANGKRDWLNEMQIDLPAVGNFNLDDYVPQLVENTTGVRADLSFKISHAEFEFHTLRIYGKNLESLTNEYQLVIVKKNEVLEKIAMNGILEKEYYSITIEEESIKEGYKIYIEDSLALRQSNTAFLHFRQAIIKTNPDEKTLRFLEIINANSIGDNDLRELLEYANFEKMKPISEGNRNVPLATKISKEEDNKEYDILDEEEFNKNAEIIDSTALNNSNHLTQLEAFLDNITFASSILEDYSDSDERIAEEARETGVEDELLVVENKTQLSYNEGRSLKNKLHNTIVSLNKVIDNKRQIQLDYLLKRKAFYNLEIIEDLKMVLIGVHLMIMKMNETFKEERIQLKIKFNSADDLIPFEKERGYNIIRAKSQADAAKDEVLYSADLNLLSHKVDLFSNHPNLELSYIDETPSIVINHNFFDQQPIFKGSQQNLVTIKGFLMNTVSPLTLLLLNIEESIIKEKAIKVSFDTYRKRLLYRVLLLFNSVHWSNKELDDCQLFLLNLFQATLPENTNTEEVKAEFLGLRNKLEEQFEENSKSVSFFESNLKSYLKWIEVFRNDRSRLIQVLDRRDVDRIVYKTGYGFSRIVTVYENALNVETPLGFFNEDTVSWQIRDIRGGRKGIIYK